MFSRGGRTSMLIATFQEKLAEACPEDSQLIFAVLVNGNRQNLSVRFSGSTGKGVLDKFLTSVASQGRLRDLIDAGPSYTSTKVLFQLLGIAKKGDASGFRRQWYAKYLDLVERIHGRGFAAIEILKLQPHRELQFQATIALDTLEILDFKLSKSLESVIEDRGGLARKMQDAHTLNMPGYKNTPVRPRRKSQNWWE